IGRPRPGVATDRVEQHHPVVLQLTADGLEIFVVSRYADVLEHAHRYDAVERLTDVAVVLKAELDALGESRLPGPAGRDAELVLRQGDAGHPRVGHAGEIKRHAAETAADIEHGAAVLQEKLCRNMTLLPLLRVVQRLAGTLEIGAGVLAVCVEEELLSLPAVLVSAGHVLP